MSAYESPALPGFSFTEDNHLVTSKGTKLKRYGSTRQACSILDDCDVKVVYELHKAGVIRAYKLRPQRPNSHLKIDLVSVWEYKQRQLAGLKAG